MYTLVRFFRHTYIQLRRLEFFSIRCLAQRPDGLEVCKKKVTIDLNMQTRRPGSL
ncbi:hypothetical protein B0O99DRAFT_640879, partial [Bisporella sp. PMI_857]